MSIILSGLTHFFQPLLSSLSGVLECKGVGPWYFLMGLRIVAIFFSNGPWDSTKQDVACNWIAPIEEKSLEFCTILCHNQHFPVSISATWALVFIVLLLLVGLMRLTIPKGKKKKEGENGNGNGNSSRNGNGNGRCFALGDKVPPGSKADIPTVYIVGHHELPKCCDHNDPQSYHPPNFQHPGWPHSSDTNNMPMAPMSGGYDTNMGLSPYDTGRYDAPSNPGGIDPSPRPDQCYNMPERTMKAYPTDVQQSKMTTRYPQTDPYGKSAIPSPRERINVAPYFDEPKQYKVPGRCASVRRNNSLYKGKMFSHCELGDTDNEGLQRRYMEPEEYGEPVDCSYPRGISPKYAGKGHRLPRYCEDGDYSMATNYETDPELQMDHFAIHPRRDGSSMAIKRRPSPGSKMKNKPPIIFDATDRNDMDFGSRMCSQPWVVDGPNYNPMDETCTMTRPGMATGPVSSCRGDAPCTCPETAPCGVDPSFQPQNDPNSRAECSSNRCLSGESLPEPPNEVTLSLTNICGIPLFDIWVGLLLVMEIGFLCAILLFQMPRLTGRSWLCSPVAVGCPEAVECTVKGRSEKRMALWGLAFTSILFIVACTGYFNLRCCWNKRCRQMCGEEVEGKGEGPCVEDTKSEDGESSSDEHKEEGV